MLQETTLQETNGSDSESSTVTASSSSTSAKKVPEQPPASMSLKSQLRNAPMPRRSPSVRSIMKDELGSVSEHEAITTFEDSESTLGHFDENSIFGSDVDDDISYETDDDQESFAESIESELTMPSRAAPLRRGVVRNKSDELGYASENVFGGSANAPNKLGSNNRSINRGQLKRNKSDDLGSMSDHVLSNISGKETRPPRTGKNRRLSMTRNQSVCIRASHDDSQESSTEHPSNDNQDPRTEHITLVSLMNICSTPVDSNKSILKHVNNSSSGQSSSNTKTLRFATNRSTGNVWILPKTFDNSYLNDLDDDLWWSEIDLDKRIDQDSDLVGLVEDRLFDVLDRAFDSCSKHDEQDEVELDLKAFGGCSLARGLEAEVFFEMKALRKRHRRAVLAAQSLVRGGSLRGSSEPVTVLSSSELELIGTQSRRLSNSFRLVAMKIGESDALSAAKLG